MFHAKPPSDNVVMLPFVAARRAASEPAIGQFGRLLGGSSSMQDMYRRIAKVAPTTATVLISGESGSGKEVVATTIHERSARAAGPFVALNCGAIPGNLIEAELFGYERGAFTGAARTHRGAFERASDGTLFLDEIAEMAPDMQVRLLRALETGRYTRVGGEREREAAARIIAATNREPHQAVRDGGLREDLLYRLAVVPIVVPSLRERDGDAEMLAEHFLRQLNVAEGTQKAFTPAALAVIRRHSWPGNVRELKNSVHRAYILGDERIDFDVSDRENAAPARPCLNIRVGTALAQIEKLAIHATLEACAGDKRRCADLLGISRKTLYNRLAGYHAAPAVTAP
jgi:DNA-binding NtrC family response regulator